MQMNVPWRKTTQLLAPARHTPSAPGQYDLYPGFPVGSGQIALGYDALAVQLAGQTQVMLDGYGGVLWANLLEQLDAALK
ncbi:MAG: hypothetical protein K8J31_07670, partial [Anaerolineae bacterium]|nr:hypothetical protein [Anaerolineae bacterium]